jgi:hypothetical protein
MTTFFLRCSVDILGNGPFFILVIIKNVNWRQYPLKGFIGGLLCLPTKNTILIADVSLPFKVSSRNVIVFWPVCASNVGRELHHPN